MRYLILHFLLCFYSISLSAQKHDNIWYLGYGGGTETPYDDEWGVNIFTFSEDSLQIVENQYYQTDFSYSNSILSDSTGRLILYSNGQHIYNGDSHEIMLNGDFIGTNNVSTGYNLPQGVITLPIDSKKKKFLLFNMESSYHDGSASGENLFLNVISKNSENIDSVFVKRALIIEDYIPSGQITAIKHANGRDWWVTVPKWNSPFYYQLLVDTVGIALVDTLVTDNINQSGVGMAKYSPDGSKYVRAVSRVLGEPFRIDIFDFDRCTGQLSNQQTHYNPQEGFGAWVSFSPDSRYLYISRSYKVFQYDLSQSDVFASEVIVAEYDGFISNNIPQAPTFFGPSQQGPDDRIYIASTHTGKHLHYINFPNRLGEECKVVQHGIELPVYNNHSLPNLPNFRLGPVDGSSCDTLGFDNHPLARFRWDFEDTLTPLRVTFTDMSAYEPDSWHWAFGDGVTYDTTASGEVFHIFPAPGLYTVCLIAGNMNSADTVCYDIQVGQSVGSVEVPEAEWNASIWPNPCRDQFTVHVNGAAEWARVDMEMYDALGRPAGHQAWRGPVGQVPVKGLPGGVYSARVLIEGKYAGTLQVLKVE